MEQWNYSRDYLAFDDVLRRIVKAPRNLESQSNYCTGWKEKEEKGRTHESWFRRHRFVWIARHSPYLPRIGTAFGIMSMMLSYRTGRDTQTGIGKKGRRHVTYYWNDSIQLGLPDALYLPWNGTAFGTLRLWTCVLIGLESSVADRSPRQNIFGIKRKARLHT